MRKLYREFFYIPRHGKIREKVMLARMVSTIAIVVVCLAAMSITAYACFSANITSGSNIIKSATFQTKVQVWITNQDGTAVNSDTITPITSDYKSFKIEGLEVGKIYTVTIEPHITDTSAKTGFVIVSADNCKDVYHTQQLGVDENAPEKYRGELKFDLMITDATNVYLRAHWGTSSYYGYEGYPDNDNEKYVFNGETVTMIVNGHTTPNIPLTEDNTENTTPPAESTTPPASATNPPATETTPPTTSTETTTPETTGTDESKETTEPTDQTEESTDKTEETTGSAEQQSTAPSSTDGATTSATTETTETQPVTTAPEATETTGATTAEETQ